VQIAPGLCQEEASLKKIEGAGKTGCPLRTHGPRAKKLRERALTTGERGNHAGLPCAMALRLIRVLPGEPACLPPSSARCVCRILANLAPCMGAPGPHDFAVREAAARRSPASASTAFHPASVTTAIRPSMPGWNKTRT
jgi:hypothetical protein